MAETSENGPKLRRAALIALANAWKGPAPLPAPPAPRKRMGVEDLLRWAYCIELPKQPRQAGPMGMPVAWDKVAKWMEELTLTVGDGNGYGVEPDLTAADFPHADALAVHAAMERLDGLQVEMPEGLDLLSDLPEIESHHEALVTRALDQLCVFDREGRRWLKSSPRRLVFRHAILGGCPDWIVDAPEVKAVSEYGKVKWFVREVMVTDGAFGPVNVEIEVDGYDQRRHVPKPGAYTKTVLDPDPLWAVVGRMEYQIWRSALDMLVEDLSAMLRDHEALASTRPVRPWDVPAGQGPAVLADLSASGDVRLAAFVNETGKMRGGRKMTATGS